MKKQELNIAEILKSIGAEKGYPLYSPIIGECTLESMYETGIMVYCNDSQFTFYPNGTFSDCDGAECLLFPSKDNRDWSTVKPKKPKKQEHQFKPFDRVLVKCDYTNKWKAAFYSHYNPRFGHVIAGHGSYGFRQCIPYEGNEHLLGTRDKPEEQE